MRVITSILILSISGTADADRLDRLDDLQPDVTWDDPDFNHEGKSAREMSEALGSAFQSKSPIAIFESTTEELAKIRPQLEERRKAFQIAEAETGDIRVESRILKHEYHTMSGHLQFANQELSSERYDPGLLSQRYRDDLPDVGLFRQEYVDLETDERFLTDFWTTDPHRRRYAIDVGIAVNELGGLGVPIDPFKPNEFLKKFDDNFLKKIHDKAISELGRAGNDSSKTELLQKLVHLTSMNHPTRRFLRHRSFSLVMDRRFWGNHRELADDVMGLFEALKNNPNATAMTLDSLSIRPDQFATFDSFRENFDAQRIAKILADVKALGISADDLPGLEGLLGKLEGHSASLDEYLSKKNGFLKIHHDYSDQFAAYHLKRAELKIAEAKEALARQPFEELVEKERGLLGQIDELKYKDVRAYRLGETGDDALQSVRREMLDRIATNHPDLRISSGKLLRSAIAGTKKLLPGIFKIGGAGAVIGTTGKMVYDGVRASRGKREEVDLSQVPRRTSSNAAR